MTPNRRRSHYYGQVLPENIPWDALPIPYSLTAFGKLYLAYLRFTESQEDSGAVVLTSSGIFRRQPLPDPKC